MLADSLLVRGRDVGRASNDERHGGGHGVRGEGMGKELYLGWGSGLEPLSEFSELVCERSGQLGSEAGVVFLHVVDFVEPALFIYAEEFPDIIGVELQIIEVEGVLSGEEADGAFDGAAGSFDAFADPFEDAAVFAEAGPEPASVVTFTEPIDEEHAWEFGAVGAVGEVEPMAEVIAHVIAAEGEHGEGVATEDAGLTEGGCGGFRAGG